MEYTNTPMLLTPSGWAQTAVENSQEDGLYALISHGLMGVVHNLKGCKIGPLLVEYVNGMSVRCSTVINNMNQARLESEDESAETGVDTESLDYKWSDITYIIGDFDNHEGIMSSESDPKVKQEVANLAFFYAVAASK